ncbi:MAG: hypothetical protein ACLT4C_09290 [Butyricicoccus sp.]
MNGIGLMLGVGAATSTRSRGAERSDSGQRIHARGGAWTAARLLFLLGGLCFANRSRACSARTRRRSA